MSVAALRPPLHLGSRNLSFFVFLNEAQPESTCLLTLFIKANFFFCSTLFSTLFVDAIERLIIRCVGMESRVWPIVWALTVDIVSAPCSADDPVVFLLCPLLHGAGGTHSH